MSKQTYPQKPIIVVVGPTASGKSDLAVKLAKKINGEVISADSRQVYRDMNIGTGKVPLSSSPLTQRGVRGVKPSGHYRGIAHYLLDVASPSRRFTAAQYKKLAQKVILDIQRREKLPIVCGGTGFYIRTLIDDLDIPAVKPDLKLRARLEKKSTAELFIELKKLDPRRAKEIDRHNPRRLVRALEIIYKTGKIIPALNPPAPPFTRGVDSKSPLTQNIISYAPLTQRGVGGLKPLFLGIQFPRPILARRIKIRLQKRLKQGMLAEVKKLRSQGLSWKRLDSFGLEYRWLAKYLQKKISYQEMVARLQKDIEHYAKRQITWFKRDERIHWIKNPAQAKKITTDFLKKSTL